MHQIRDLVELQFDADAQTHGDVKQQIKQAVQAINEVLATQPFSLGCALSVVTKRFNVGTDGNPDFIIGEPIIDEDLDCLVDEPWSISDVQNMTHIECEMLLRQGRIQVDNQCAFLPEELISDEVDSLIKQKRYDEAEALLVPTLESLRNAVKDMLDWEPRTGSVMRFRDVREAIRVHPSVGEENWVGRLPTPESAKLFFHDDPV